jgi:carboxypeptidase PM20D1
MKLSTVSTAVGVAVALLAGALVLKATWGAPGQQQVTPPKPLEIDARAIDRFAASVKFKTVAQVDDAHANAGEFKQFHAYLQSAFPRVHQVLKREIVADYALVYTWAGTEPSAKPALWIAHQDVVPVSEDTQGHWTVPPFAGVVKDGHVWGRGSWDNKSHILAQLEAIEMLLAQGWQPRQTLYLAYGHDEEIVGLRGAKAIAAQFRARKMRFDYVLDEGLIISDGIIKGAKAPVALVGVAEKGYATLQLKLSTDSGHSSMPTPMTSINRMAEAVTRVNKAAYPAKVGGLTAQMFETIAPHSGWVNRLILSNLWLTEPLVSAQLAETPLTNAMIRTTTAATVFRSGEKENVLPGQAEALINVRMLPGDSSESVLKRAVALVGDDGIKVSLAPGVAEASTVSSTTSASYRSIERSVREVFTDAIVAPGLVIGGTDSKHYWDLADNTYRFTPLRVKPSETARFHGVDERISVAAYQDMVRFYHRLLQAK